MQKWARFTRQVESSMIRLTGTRPRGFRTVTPSACFGRSPLNWANAGTCPKAAPANPRADVRRNSRRETVGDMRLPGMLIVVAGVPTLRHRPAGLNNQLDVPKREARTD